MSVADTAKVLKRTDETVCAFIRRGELPASGLGTDKQGGPCAPYVVLAEDLFEFLRARRVQPTSVHEKTKGAASTDQHAGRRRTKARQTTKLVTPRSPR